MNIRKYISIDYFRIIAALLIVAIHIYPFIKINETINFVFTHIICRLGVPFFLVITGYFTLPRCLKNKENLWKYMKRILKLYIFCIILYFPINLYSGQIKDVSAIQIIKDVLINGTFYHLWYLPATILGMLITYFIIRNMNRKMQIVIITTLYIIGLFGDSYYGIAQQSEILKNLYSIIFTITDYTRNGLFFSPIFLYIGYEFSKNNKQENVKKTYIKLFIFGLSMIMEGLILYIYDLQRHTSMYIMLVPTIYFLFKVLLNYKNQPNKKIRSIATNVYILHPIFIIFIRGVGKITNLSSIIVENNLIHYIIVCSITLVFCIVFDKIKDYFIKKQNNINKTEL